MHVKIPGAGCTNCKNLERKVRDRVSRHGIDAEITKVSELQDIMSYGIMRTSGLVINEMVKSVGIIPKDDQILVWLREVQQ
jgi:small redox-active disulfide protein 2